MPLSMPSAAIATPVGRLTVSESGGRVTGISWRKAPEGEMTPTLKEALTQIHDYFEGSRKDFDLPLADAASAAELAVRDAMLAIPAGSTLTYGDIGKQTGLPPQTVGQFCGRNPYPIVVPCHRVVGQAVSGYYSGAGGADTKHWLLAHEGATLI